jgi:hypothetical protein
VNEASHGGHSKATIAIVDVPQHPPSTSVPKDKQKGKGMSHYMDRSHMI